jgi:hypothetical protein
VPQFQKALGHYHWEFICSDFETIISQATANDLIYWIFHQVILGCLKTRCFMKMYP